MTFPLKIMPLVIHTLSAAFFPNKKTLSIRVNWYFSDSRLNCNWKPATSSNRTPFKTLLINGNRKTNHKGPYLVSKCGGLKVQSRVFLLSPYSVLLYCMGRCVVMVNDSCLKHTRPLLINHMWYPTRTDSAHTYM